MFDWQNVVFLLVIFSFVLASKLVFRAVYERYIVVSHTSAGVNRGLVPLRFSEPSPRTDPPQSQGPGSAPLSPGPGPGGGAGHAGHGGATIVVTHWARSLESPAFLIALSGFLFAVTSICAGAISEFAPTPQGALLHVGWDSQSTSRGAENRLKNILSCIVWGCIGVVLMLLSQVVTRHFTFAGLDLVGHITGQTQRAKERGFGHNIAAGVLDGGSVVAAGLVSAANVSGAPRGWGEDLLSTLLFFVLSQIAFTVYTVVFDYFYIGATEGNAEGTLTGAVARSLGERHAIRLPGRALPLLRQGNVAVSLSYAAMMVSYALLLGGSVYQSYELLGWAMWAVGGGALLLLFRALLDWVLAPHIELDRAMAVDFNWGFALVVGSMQLAVSHIFVGLISMDCTPYKYTGGPGLPKTPTIVVVGGDAQAAFVEDSDLKLFDALAQYQQTMDVFTWPKLVGLLIALLILGLSKFTYQLLGYLKLGAEFRMIDRITGTYDDSGAAAHAHATRPGQGQGGVPANRALAISFAGYIYSVGRILAGLFGGSQRSSIGLSADTADANDGDDSDGMRIGIDILWAIFGLIALLITQVVADLVIFHKWDNVKELVERNNIALACVEAGVFVGASLVVAACTQAENLALALTMFVLGLGGMLLFSLGYEQLTSYDDRRAIQSNNVAAGLNWGLSMVSFGLLVSRAVVVSNSIWVLLVWSSIGCVILLAYRKLVDETVLREIHLDDELELDPAEAQRGVITNWGAALIAGVMSVSLAQCLNTFLRDCEYEFAG
jgi:uncharacterized membrane protein YjfL (UPF0719 family)